KELPKELPKRVVQKKEKVMAEIIQEERSKPAEISASVIKEVVDASAPEIDSSDIFLKQLLKFFQKNSIRVLEQKVIKKKADYEFIVELNSVVGSLTYFCKAKNKKRIGDGDISSAFVQGQLKKLPVLFVAPGELSRQAQVIAKELKGVAVKKLDG
ncbi:MAG: hypothetical protein QW666_00730, partial [Candidatus Woesearchaeota archaeon]